MTLLSHNVCPCNAWIFFTLPSFTPNSNCVSLLTTILGCGLLCQFEYFFILSIFLYSVYQCQHDMGCFIPVEVTFMKKTALINVLNRITSEIRLSFLPMQYWQFVIMSVVGSIPNIFYHHVNSFENITLSFFVKLIYLSLSKVLVSLSFVIHLLKICDDEPICYD